MLTPMLTMIASLLALGSPPASERPVHWALHGVQPAARAGERFEVRVDASIDPGWHLYALEEPQGGPIPTEIGIAEGDPASLLRVDSPPPRRLLDSGFQVVTAYFEDAAQFTLRLRADRAATAGGHALHVLVRYQACNDRMCLPPRNDTVVVPLQIQR